MRPARVQAIHAVGFDVLARTVHSAPLGSAERGQAPDARQPAYRSFRSASASSDVVQVAQPAVASYRSDPLREGIAATKRREPRVRRVRNARSTRAPTTAQAPITAKAAAGDAGVGRPSGARRWRPSDELTVVLRSIRWRVASYRTAGVPRAGSAGRPRWCTQGTGGRLPAFSPAIGHADRGDLLRTIPLTFSNGGAPRVPPPGTRTARSTAPPGTSAWNKHVRARRSGLNRTVSPTTTGDLKLPEAESPAQPHLRKARPSRRPGDLRRVRCMSRYAALGLGEASRSRCRHTTVYTPCARHSVRLLCPLPSAASDLIGKCLELVDPSTFYRAPAPVPLRYAS